MRLPDTAHRFSAGHRIARISGGAHPALRVQQGTGEQVGSTTHGQPVTHPDGAVGWLTVVGRAAGRLSGHSVGGWAPTPPAITAAAA